MMTLRRLFLALTVLAALAGTAFLAREAEGPGLRMTTAAEKFLATLKPEQKTKAVFEFDSKERFQWFFTPQQKDRKATRKGLPLEEMTADQRKLALELIRTGTSEEGYKKATTIMSLESILANLEKKGAMVRDPDWYFFTFFGTPSKTGKWGWRVEGHHLSLNYTVEGGRIVSATPAFFGANPADVKAGPRKGLRTLADEMDFARDLVKQLDDEQHKAAKQLKRFEIEEAKQKPTVGGAVGLPAAKMNEKQKATLVQLIEAYARRLPTEVASELVSDVKKTGIDKVHFAYGDGDGTPGQPFVYRVQGPTFLVEYVNTQNDSAGNKANHIHSAWRNVKGDFGLSAP
jgi:hypothetical protein